MSKRAVLRADDRIALVAEVLERRIVHPDVHRELELADQARAPDEGGDASFHAVVRRAFGQAADRRCLRAGSSCAAARSRRCPAGSCAECARRSGSRSRAGPSSRSRSRWCAARSAPSAGIVLLRREDERSAAAPPPHQLRGDELLLVPRVRPCRRRKSRKAPTCSCSRRYAR